MTTMILQATLLLGLAAAPEESVKLDYTTRWVGNSFGGGPKWVQNLVSAVALDEDDTVFTNHYWDEAGRQGGIYRDGDVVGLMKDAHGWGHGGGEAIAVDDRYVYMGFQQISLKNHPELKGYPPWDKNWFCVSRRNKDGSHAPFPGGTGDKGDLIMISVGESADVKSHKVSVHGLAVDGGELFVSDPMSNQVRVFQTSTMREVRHWDLDDPRDIAASKQTIWVIQGDPTNGNAKPVEFTRDGKPTGKVISGIAAPMGLCFDRQGRVLVADNGPRQQILIYDVSGAQPKLVDTLGEERGVYAGPVHGKVGPNRFCGPNSVAVNAKGNIAVTCQNPAGGAVIRLFSPSHEMIWELLGLEFVSVADADPKSDGKDLYSPERHYRLDPNGWSWQGFTLDPFTSPDDPRHKMKRMQNTALIRYLDGKKFLIVRGMWQQVLAFYRFDGEIARPSTIIVSVTVRPNEPWKPPGKPEKGRWIWRDRNGDARMQANEYSDADGKNDGQPLWASFVDERGDVWQGSAKGPIRHFRFGGLDRVGNPIYSRTPRSYEEIKLPPPLNHLLRMEYIPATDTMYLSGHPPEHPKSDKACFGLVGSTLVRYDNWSTRKRRLRWRIELPNPDTFMKGAASMCVEANRVFIAMGEAEVRVHDTETGAYIGSMTPGPEVFNHSGWIDTRDGIRARKLSDGDFLVMIEEVYKAKIIVYRLKGQK